MSVFPLGDSAAVIVLGEVVDPAMTARVRAVAAEIERHPPLGTVDVVPAFASVAVFFDPLPPGTWSELAAHLDALVARAEAGVVSQENRLVEIPVLYGGADGPDLAEVAAHAGVTEDEVVALHTGAEYAVHAIGFAPGFPYLGGLPPRLATPRRATPRSRVPAGSVGIGGAQTGIYPLETPGGWNLIGRTPVALFDPARAEPALLRAGDRVRFRALRADSVKVEPAAASAGETAEHETAVAGSDRGEAGHAGLEVVRPGMYTTVQDLGRRGHRARGVPLSGAADPFALRLLNALVGNPDDSAGLEFTLVGPRVTFHRDAVIAVGGGEFGDLPRWRPLAVTAGTTLDLGRARSGCRGYLAVAGGLPLAPVLGSRSTYVRGNLGGWCGRSLRAGDVLPLASVQRRIRNHWHIDERILPPYAAAPEIRVIAGAQAEEFDPGWLGRTYRVSTHSDRMGVRLSGDPVARRGGGDLVSSPVAPGTVQVPPDGQPIVLLADAQTIGGYPKVAHVVSVDIPHVAQWKPGDAVRFRRVTLDEARSLAAAREKAFGLLREGLAQKLA
jgi:KipI family sensor histidine kinase inhibitor